MEDVVIVAAVRTPGGRRRGALAGWHPVDLAALVVTEVIRRANVGADEVDDVVMGCVSQVGEQGLNVGRQAVLAAGLPEVVPGTTVDRQCGSSEQALHFVAHGIAAGAYDVAVAAGVESMTRVPLGASVASGPGRPASPALDARYADRGGLVHQGVAAEMIADLYGLERPELDAYALRSHRRAWRATEEGAFAAEIVPVPIRDREGRETGDVLARDEGIRPDTSLEVLATLPPVFREGGRITAGNSSQVTDGAAALLLMSRAQAAARGIQPLATVRATAVVGVDPVTMLLGPAPATRKVLAAAGLGLEEIDHFEVNEAFASVVLAFERELHPDMERVNPLGGAIALGHPLGASGARLATTLVHSLVRSGRRYGLQTMCAGGGLATATIFERS